MKLIIGTICKNIEHSIPAFLESLHQIVKVFPDAIICIYENNSTDKTKVLLEVVKQITSNVHIRSEDFTQTELLEKCKSNTWDMKPCRMELIAIARNKLLDMIETVGYQDDDLIMMFDSDISRPFDISVLKDRIINFPTNTDVLLANGVNSRGEYYDMYALRNQLTPFGPEIIGDSFWKKMPSLRITTPTRCYSGFGGLGIYKGYCIRNNRYSAFPTKELDTFNKSLLSLYKDKLPTVSEPCSNGCLIGMYLFGVDGLFYYNNSGYNIPVVCEHSTFHARMASRGQTNLVIDPALIYYSGH